MSDQLNEAMRAAMAEAEAVVSAEEDAARAETIAAKVERTRIMSERCQELFDAAKAELMPADNGEVFFLAIPMPAVMEWEDERRVEFGDQLRRALTGVALDEFLAEMERNG